MLAQGLGLYVATDDDVCDVTSEGGAVDGPSLCGEVNGCFRVAGQRPIDFAASSPPHRINGRPVLTSDSKGSRSYKKHRNLLQ